MFQQKWGKFSVDDIDDIGGQKKELVGRLERIYGVPNDEAEKQVNEFASSLHEEDDDDDDFLY